MPSPEQELAERLEPLAGLDVTELLLAQKKYGDSWRKRGGWEAFANLSRKWDRIELACAKHKYDLFLAIDECRASDGTLGGKDGLLDDLRDLRRYLLLVEEYITRGEP